MKPKAIIAIAAGVVALAATLWFTVLSDRGSSAIVIATYNADGLLEEGDRAQLEAIGRALRALKADVIAIQGVESERSIRAFADSYLTGLGYKYIVSAGDSGAAAASAVLSRYPLGEPRSFQDEPLDAKHPRSAGGRANPFAGKPMRFSHIPILVEVDIPGKTPLVLLTIDHRGGNRFSYWREAEAHAATRLAKKHAHGGTILIAGSMHDEKGSPVLESYNADGFVDPLKGRPDLSELITESTGDRTDFIVCQRRTNKRIDAKRAKVAEISLQGVESWHHPLAIRLKPER